MTPVRPLPTTTAVFGLLHESATSGVAAAALHGDPVAREYAVPDLLEEQGQNVVPFAVGEKHLIQTETLYWVGEVVAIGGGFVELKDASWVHWTGRLGSLCEALSFTRRTGWAGQRPRTEFVGDGVRVSLSKIVNTICKDWELPSESVTA